MSGDPTPAKREHSHPSPEMEAWFKLAATYERAKLGNSITPQTEQALQQMVTFLMQPAQCYTPVVRREDSDTARPDAFCTKQELVRALAERDAALAEIEWLQERLKDSWYEDIGARLDAAEARLRTLQAERDQYWTAWNKAEADKRTLLDAIGDPDSLRLMADNLTGIGWTAEAEVMHALADAAAAAVPSGDEEDR